MTFFLLLIFILGCIFLGIKGLARRGFSIYEPWLPMAAVFLGFVGLQLIGLSRSPWGLPPDALDKTIVMATLCLFGFWWGYSTRVKPLVFLSGEFSQSRLFFASFFLTFFGASFFFLISRLPQELVESGMWTGLPVAYLFFAQTLSYGFALACLLFFRYGDRRAFWIAVFGATFYLDRILIAGRRASAAEFFFIIVLALFFGRGYKLPRWVMVGVMLVMVLLMHSTGEYRAMSYEQGWKAPLLARSINFVDNLVNVAKSGGVELRNAVYMIEAYDQNLDFDFGLYHWNITVFNYVPAQLVGPGIKDALLIDLPNVAEQVFGNQSTNGSTVTGIVDAFGSFWYMGWVKFFLIGLILKKIWSAAQNQSFAAQLLYMLLIVKSLHVVTHHTHWFFSPWVHMTVFLFPFLLWARRRQFLGKRGFLFHKAVGRV